MMLRRWIACCLILIAPLSWADWAADRDASAGYVTVTTLATAVDEAVPFVVVYLSDLPADFHTAMDAASDTDGKTIRVSNSDGTTQLACVPIGVNTATDTGCLIFLGTGMSASVDVDYRIYVGNASLSMPSASGGMGEQAVFAAYAGVYFPGVDTRDWTSGGRTLTAVNSPGTAASGYEGITAATYNGTSQYHRATTGTQAVTNWPVHLDLWAAPDTETPTQEAFGLSDDNSTSTLAALAFRGGDANDPIAAQFRGASGSISIASGTTNYAASTYYYVAGNRNANTGTSRKYVDGAADGTETTTITSPDFQTLYIGATYRNGTASNYFDGNVAVALLSSSVRSADYVSTMQDNWAGTMYSAGAWTALDTDCTTGSTGWVLFTAVAQSTSADMNWTDLANAIIDDSTYAWADLEFGVVENTEYLNLTDIDFDTTTIPVGADSYTVQVRVKKYRGTGGGDEINDLTVQFIDETGTRIGDNMADTGTDWPTTASTFDYTITGHVFDGTEFDADSGLAFRATGNNGASISQARFVTGWMKIDWNCGDDAAKARGFFALTE